MDNAGLHDPVLTAGAIWKQVLSGCFHIQVTDTATQNGVNNKEMYYLTEKTIRGWEGSGLLTRWLNSILRPWCVSLFHSPLIWFSSRSLCISVEAPKVTCRHFQCPEETTGELSFIISLIRSGEIFPRSIPPVLTSNWPELAHIVHAAPLTG